MFRVLLLLSVFCFSLLGCGGVMSGGGKRDVVNNPGGEAGDGVPDLANKTIKEVLELKYEKADLTCQLWIQKRKKIDTSQEPENHFSVSLLSETLKEDFYALDGLQYAVEVETLFKVNSFLISNYSFTDKEGKTIEKTYSPFLNLSYGGKVRVTFSNGEFFDTSLGDDFDLFEGASRQVWVTHFTNPTTGEVRWIEIRCEVDAELKEEFKDIVK